MRLFRVLLVALFGVFAVIAGLFTAAVVSLATAGVLLVRRLLRPSATTTQPPRPARVSRPAAGEVIDITATEVPVESHPR